MVIISLNSLKEKWSSIFTQAFTSSSALHFFLKFLSGIISFQPKELSLVFLAVQLSWGQIFLVFLYIKLFLFQCLLVSMVSDV